MFQTFETGLARTGTAAVGSVARRAGSEGLAGFMVRAPTPIRANMLPRATSGCNGLMALPARPGSAWCCRSAGVFIDGRYRVQVKGQVDWRCSPRCHGPKSSLYRWIMRSSPDGHDRLDPWFHSVDEIGKLETTLEERGVTLDQSTIWSTRSGQISRDRRSAWPLRIPKPWLAKPACQRARLAEDLRQPGRWRRL